VGKENRRLDRRSEPVGDDDRDVEPPGAAAYEGPDVLAAYDASLPYVYGYLLSRCGQVALAEDLTSETFLAAVDAVRSEHAPALTRGWLIGVARHKLADHWRRTAREQRRLETVAGSSPGLVDPTEHRLDALVAADVLRRLAPQHRLVLTLRYVDDLPVAAVAEHVGRTVHATEALLARARESFRRAYPHQTETAEEEHRG
jgi:RNA polymerase sigma-70 factor (ECF subfamily)